MNEIINTTENFKKEQETIKRNVMELLIKYPEAKQDDDILTQLYHFHIDGLKNFIPFSVIKQLTNNNSIERSRRKIMEIARRKLNKPLTSEQENYWKQFLPKEETQEAIELKETEFREHYKENETF